MDNSLQPPYTGTAQPRQHGPENIFLKFVWLLLFRYAAVVPLDDEVLPRYGNTLVRRTKYGQYNCSISTVLLHYTFCKTKIGCTSQRL
jgi:hypothetical protein